MRCGGTRAAQMTTAEHTNTTAVPARGVSRRSERARRAVAARRARRRSAGVLTAFVGAGVLLGLAGVGGTYSFLTAQITAPASVVKAGSLSLTVDGAQSAALAALQLAPNVWQLRSVTVMNTGDAPAALTASAAITSADPISADAVVRLTTVPFGSTCVAGGVVPTAPLSGFSGGLGSLAPGERTVACLEVGLRPATPPDRSGQAIAFQLTITAQQQAG